jgi:hypothetical protein
MSSPGPLSVQPREATLDEGFRGRRLAVLVLGAGLLYGLGLNDCWRFQRDSALYLTLARSLAETGTYSFDYRPHVLALPGLPGMLSLVYMTVGESYLAMNALMALFGLGCIAMACLVYRRLPLSPVQVLACMLLFAFSRALYYYSMHIMSDVPFAFFVLVGLYCGLRMLRPDSGVGWAWCAAAAGTVCAATATRPLGPALLAALVAGLWLRPRGLKRWGPNLAATALLALPLAVLGAAWAWRCARAGTAGSMGYYDVFVGQQGVPKAALLAVTKVPDAIGALQDAILGVRLPLAAGLLLLIPTVVGFVAAVRGGERVVSVYGLVYLGGICLGSPGRRYLLPALPVLLYWLVLGAGIIGEHCARRWKSITPDRVARLGAVLLLLAVAVNVVRIGKVIYEQRSPRFYEVTEEGRLPDYFALCLWLKENVPAEDVVLAYEYRLIHYLSRVRAAPLPAGPEAWRAYAAWMRASSRSAFYVVRDPERDSRTGGTEAAFQSLGAAAKVHGFGRIDLYRLFPDRLTADPTRRTEAG